MRSPAPKETPLPNRDAKRQLPSKDNNISKTWLKVKTPISMKRGEFRGSWRSVHLCQRRMSTIRGGDLCIRMSNLKQTPKMSKKSQKQVRHQKYMCPKKDQKLWFNLLNKMRDNQSLNRNRKKRLIACTTGIFYICKKGSKLDNPSFENSSKNALSNQSWSQKESRDPREKLLIIRSK